MLKRIPRTGTFALKQRSPIVSALDDNSQRELLNTDRGVNGQCRQRSPSNNVSKHAQASLMGKEIFNTESTE